MKTALVVIDVQSYFLRKAPKDLPARIAEHINERSYDCLVFTTFFNSDNSNYEKSFDWHRCKSEKDMELPVEFKPFVSSENVFRKSTYSAFKVPKFEAYLVNQQIERLAICSIDSDACVLATAFEAFDKDYRVEVLLDLSWSRYNLGGLEEIVAKNLQSKH